MAVLITLLAYLLQLGALFFLPALLFFCLRLCVQKMTALIAALLCAALIFTGTVWLSFHPIRRCPDELEPYMTEARWQDILSVTPPIYSRSIPFFPLVITIEQATEDTLLWRVNWFLVGVSRTGITPDGYTSIHALK